MDYNKNFVFRIIAPFLICIGLLIPLTSFPKSVSSFQLMPTSTTSKLVLEHLRLKVPKEYKSAWLQAEEVTWGTWLQNQKGFQGRQLLWDPNSEEATVLITWASRSAWKKIPLQDIDEVQNSFEEIAREVTGQKSGNPFPLEFEGELLPQ